MNKAALTLGGIVLLFGAVAFLKARAAGDATEPSVNADSAAARASVREFWTRYRAATNARVAGDVAAARDAYRTALALNPQHEDVLYYLGNMELELGNYGAAEIAWRRLLEINAASARTHSRLGDLYACPDSGAPWDVARADAEFSRAAALNREETGPLLRLGEVALLRRDLDVALSHFEAVLVTHPRSVEAHYLAGYVGWKHGRRDLAAEQYQTARALAQAPQTIPAAPSEGDTRRGMTPLVVRTPRCRIFGEELEPYAHLDRRLEQITSPHEAVR